MGKKTAIWIFCASVLLILPGVVSLYANGQYGRCMVILALLMVAIAGLLRAVSRKGRG